jgi:fatty-acyl-CoA synthase
MTMRMKARTNRRRPGRLLLLLAFLTSPVSTQSLVDDPVEKRVTTLGYWDDDAATREAIDAAGWMHTGDLAVMDDDGYVSIVGRIKDVIIRGGENVYPRELEEFLLTLPDVSEAYVIGVPSERYGEEVMARVKLHEGATAGEEELVAACRGAIATFKIPRYWRFVDEFPMTVTGKIQKFKMREAAIEELGLAEAAAIETA